MPRHHLLTFLFLSEDLSGSRSQGWLPPCVPPSAKLDTRGPQAHRHPLPLLTCSRWDVHPTAAPPPGPTNSGGGGRPSLVHSSRRENRTEHWQRSQLWLQVARAEMGLTHTSQPSASLGLSNSHLRGVNWLQPQGCSRLPDLIFTLGFPGILTQGEPFYLENAAQSLATSKIAFSSHSVHSAAEELTRTMNSGQVVSSPAGGLGVP